MSLVEDARVEWALRSARDGALAELESLAAAWLDARAGRKPTAAIDAAMREAERASRRYERKLRRLGVEL
jgi:hypothetical protein